MPNPFCPEDLTIKFIAFRIAIKIFLVNHDGCDVWGGVECAQIWVLVTHLAHQ